VSQATRPVAAEKDRFDPSAHQALQRSHAALAADHREILELLDRLQLIRDGLDLVRPLEQLHNLLVRHFAHEQFPGGLYESMGAFQPEYHALLRRLIAEHCSLLATVGSILQKARGSDADNALLDEVAQLVSALHRHERREHELVRRLLTKSKTTLRP